MKRKLILSLSFAIAIVSGLVLTAMSDFSGQKQSCNDNEGTHPKNANLEVYAINCPVPVILSANANCLAEVIVNTPVSSCNNIISMSYTLPGGSPINVTLPAPTSINLGFYPVGLFNVVWNVVDNCGLATPAVCFQPVLISDTTPPVIECPDDVVVGNRADGRKQTNLVLVGQATAEDNCGVLSVINDFNMTDDASGNYPIGTTIVCWTATDIYNNTSSCCMSVTVNDTTHPEMVCPDTIRVQCVAPQPYTYYKQYLIAGGTASDETALDTTTFNWVGDISNHAPCPEIILRRYRIGDTSGNFDTCTQVIIIRDTIAPVAICKNLTVYLNAAGEAFLQPTDLNNGSTDNCADPLEFTTNINLFFSCNDVVAGVPLPYTLIVTDSCGNTSTCISVITVKDTIAPHITCPAPVTINTSPGLCGASNVNLGLATSSDNCTLLGYIARLDNILVTNSTVFPVGNNNVIWTVTDAGGNTATCTQVVTVIDNQPPAITCPTNITVNATAGLCAANVNYTAPVGTDNCPGAFTTRTSGPASGSSFPAGITTITYEVTAANGVTATCSFTITVVDNQPPVIICPSNITVNATAGLCAANVNYTAPVGTDNCPGAVTTRTSGSASGSSFPVGITTITYEVTAANGVTATCGFTVTVVDNQPPVITCPSNITVNATAGLCAANVNYTAPVGTDNCPGAVTTRTSGPASGSSFPVGITTITYEVTAANGVTANCSFTVTVTDNQPPSITCPGNQEVNLDNNCKLRVPDLRSLVSANDNCGVSALVQSPKPDTLIESAHNQVHIFTFTVTDATGLSSACSITVTAKDRLGPDVVCSTPKIISLVTTPQIPAADFIISAVDNCGSISSIQAKRMGNICGLNTPDVFGNNVTFCCDDVNNIIPIVVRVTDTNGNTTECMTTVTVQDNSAPVVITPLPDISISCKYPLNLNNLSAFGTFITSGVSRQNIVISDPGNPYYPTGIAGQDGVYSANCNGGSVTVAVRNQLSMCNTGQIKRDFTIKDKGGNAVIFTQTIYVTDLQPFNLADIVWPAATVDYNDCNATDPDSKITGAPALNGSRCNLAGATYTDQVFSHPAYCRYVRRTWTVIDWCQYKSNTVNSPGKWTFVQNINIKNTVAPTIFPKVCRDTIICAQNANCFANVTFSATGTDDCLPLNITWSYKINLDNKVGTPDITGSGSTLTRQFNLGTHRLAWEAKDGCGNISTCSFLFTIRDCKAPSAVAMQGLAINLTPPMGMVTIKASDFNNFSSDNCTSASQLKYSFSSNTSNTTRLLTCDSLGNRKIELWVTDLAGNQSKAVTFINVQDNQHVCGTMGRIDISGNIYTEDNIRIPDTKITIDGGETEDAAMSDKDGKFGFSDLAMYNNYHLLPFKNTHHLQGISTLDLVLIQRHILGIKLLDSPYKIIAADANNSQSVTAADLVELRKMILGVQNEFSKNTSWRFVDAGQKFENPLQPWPFDETKSYESLSASMNTSDFIAVKTGDVNGSVSDIYSPKTETRNAESIILTTEDISLKAGELTSVAIIVDDLEGLIGLQGTFELGQGLTFVGIEPVSLSIKADNFARITRNNKNYVTMSFDDQNGLKLEKGAVLFNIILKADKVSMLSRVFKMNNDITRSAAFTNDEFEKNLTLIFRNTFDSTNETIISQNQPNPFRNETVVPITLNRQQAVAVSLYDASGISIYNKTEILPQGTHRILFNDNHFGNRSGVFYCKIKYAGGQRVIKMLRIE